MGRLPLAYLGGMRAVRSLGRMGSAFCLSVSAVFLWSVLRHERVDLVLVVAMYLGGVLFALGVRLQALRAIVVTREGWMLVPIVGRPRPMPRLANVYQSGDDVVAIGVDGRTIVLGVDRFPYGDPVVGRRKLLADLRRASNPE